MSKNIDELEALVEALHRKVDYQNEELEELREKVSEQKKELELLQQATDIGLADKKQGIETTETTDGLGGLHE